VLAKLADDAKNCKWIYRFPANPGMPRGGIVPPSPVLAPGSALGSRPRVALSSARSLQSTPGHGPRAIHGRGAAVAVAGARAARRRASASASFRFRSVQISPSRPASLSAGVT
jgi:hypothetical protein